MESLIERKVNNTTNTKAKKNIPLEKIIELHNQGYYDSEIAKIFGCKRHNITQRLNRAGITGRKSKINDIELRDRISKSLIGKYVGENNPNYKGRANENKLARGIFKTLSREAIRKADYTCWNCGKRGGNMETHHIVEFHIIFDNFMKNVYSGNINTFYNEITSHYPFMDKNNLIVLCECCHNNIHKLPKEEYKVIMSQARKGRCNDYRKHTKVEVSRVESSDSKCEATHVVDDIVCSA